MAVFFDITRMVIGKTNTLDLLDVLPVSWRISSIASANPFYMPPEILILFQAFETVDLDDKRIILGDVEDESQGTAEELCRILLWDILIARIIEETGLAGNDAAMKAQRALVETRREEILKALKGEVEADPKQIALKSFTRVE